jgi:phosphatidylserine/phosphatidylglycerophosphate/cardiolipin synthase-like enzyme
MARRILCLSEARKEILVLTAPPLVRQWSRDQVDALIEAASSGKSVKIYLAHAPIIPTPVLAELRGAGVKVKAGARKWLSTLSRHEEIWIFDRVLALAGNYDLRRELKSFPAEGRLSVECLVKEEGAKAAARYFDHRWDGQPEGVSLIVRHKFFTFRGGKSSEREFFPCIVRARKEICLCLTDARISSGLYRGLSEALKRGVRVRIYANTYGIKNYRNRLICGRLLRQGAELRFTIGHLALESVCALVDGGWIYLGPLPGNPLRLLRAPVNAAVFFQDKDSVTELRSNLERHVGRGISYGNSASLLNSPGSSTSRTST